METHCRRRTALIGSLVWSFLEATVFFVVPDVWLSFCGFFKFRTVVGTLLASVVGSMLGATVLSCVPAISQVWHLLPGFYPRMLEVAHGHLAQHGAYGLLVGPKSGIPYKFYVSEASTLGISLSSVLLWTPLARLERIAIAPLAVWLLWSIVRRTRVNQLRAKRILLGAIACYWIGLYVWYWGIFLPTQYG